jgi:D-tyrosyl-tRNA(Tyr) deacylase
MVLLGVQQGDSPRDIDFMVDKLANLRIFPDEQGKMNRSLLDVQGQMLLVSQFTLLGDCRKGRRPSFIQAEAPELANQLYRQVAERLSQLGISVATGIFAADMQVHLINDGPVTILLDSRAT